MARSFFAPELPSAEAARRFVEGELRRAAVDEETLFRVQLLTTELVTNAVRHANSSVELTVAHRGDRVRVEARDDSPNRPTPVRLDGPFATVDFSSSRISPMTGVSTYITTTARWCGSSCAPLDGRPPAAGKDSSVALSRDILLVRAAKIFDGSTPDDVTRRGGIVPLSGRPRHPINPGLRWAHCAS